MTDTLFLLCKPFVFLGPSDFRGAFWEACIRNLVRLLFLFVGAFALTSALVSTDVFQAPNRNAVAARFLAVQQELADPSFVEEFKKSYQIDPTAVTFSVRDTQPHDDRSYEIVLSRKNSKEEEILAVVQKAGLSWDGVRLLDEAGAWPFREVRFDGSPFMASTVLLASNTSGDLTGQERLAAKGKLDRILAKAFSAKSEEFAVARRLNGPIQFGCYFLFFIGVLLLLLHWLANVVPNTILRSAGTVRVLREVRLETVTPEAAPREARSPQVPNESSSDEQPVVIGSDETDDHDEGNDTHGASPGNDSQAADPTPIPPQPQPPKVKTGWVEVITPWSGHAIGNLDTFIAVLEEIRVNVRARSGLWGARAVFPLLDIRITGLKAMKTARSGENVPSFVAVETDAAGERLEAKHRFPAFVIWAIPTLGFIGTVVGIGDALLSTVDLQSAYELARSRAESSIGLSIGVAFDTTYVALFLSFLLMLLLHFVQDAEDNMLAREKRSALQDLLQVENLRPVNDMQDFAQMLSGWGLSLAQISRWFESLQVDQRKVERAMDAFARANDPLPSVGNRRSGRVWPLLILAAFAVFLVLFWESLVKLLR